MMCSMRTSARTESAVLLVAALVVAFVVLTLRCVNLLFLELVVLSVLLVMRGRLRFPIIHDLEALNRCGILWIDPEVSDVLQNGDVGDTLSKFDSGIANGKQRLRVWVNGKYFRLDRVSTEQARQMESKGNLCHECLKLFLALKQRTRRLCWKLRRRGFLGWV
jgi:hypothetical protein